jgi:hypothetical protein
VRLIRIRKEAVVPSLKVLSHCLGGSGKNHEKLLLEIRTATFPSYVL